MESTAQFQNTRARVLIVEDEALIAESLSRSLSRLGYQVTGIADCCEQTLAEISNARPDCILMDIRIQGALDGIETATRLRERFDIPVIYLTGQTDPQTIDRAKVTNASGFLPKPVHSVALSASIEMAVHKHKAEAEGIADERLRQSERRLQTLVEGIQDYALLLLDEQGRVSSWTANAAKIKGYGAEEILGKSFATFYTLEDVERGHPQEVLENARREGHYEEEGWRVRKDGSRFWAEVMITALRDGAGQVVGFSKMTRDITERQRSRKERNDLIAGLESAVKEKTVLLQEVHHRVKNNLAVIVAFLRMQASAEADEHLAALLEKSQQRVASMAMIHEYLYSADHFSEVNFGHYASRLANELCETYGASDRVKCVVQADNVELSMDRAIPCGLILNELLSNSFKYGFPNSRSGNIRVAFCRMESGNLSLSCHDDGVGMPERLDWENAPSLGLKIVQILAKQLKGQLSLDRRVGTRFELTLPPMAS
jgi:PAS domain S-box-containing protein